MLRQSLWRARGLLIAFIAVCLSTVRIAGVAPAWRRHEFGTRRTTLVRCSGFLGLAVALALAATGLSATSAAAAVDDLAVSTTGELQDASMNCSGTSGDPTTITLAADIADTSAQVDVGCQAVLDLAGHQLRVRNVVVNSAQALTIEDTGTGGTLTADASAASEVAGIQTNDTPLTINGGTVTATGGYGAAGIGGGYGGSGGTTTINGGTVTATGGDSAAGIGGGYGGPGGNVTINAGTVVAAGDSSAVGAGRDASVFGFLSVSGGVLRVPAGDLWVPDSAPGAEITIGPDGVIDGSAGLDATYATITGDGQIDNGGRILLPTAEVTGNGVTVLGRHYGVGFESQGGSSAPDPVTVFADSFTHGDRVFPPDPTRAGVTFAGWNTAADGTGDPVTPNSVLPGASADGAPVQITAHAQWAPVPDITGIAPSSGPMAGGTEVVITGTGFTGATKVVFGITGAATSFTVDSDTQITATAPASDTAVTRNIRVTTAGGTSPAVVAGRFTYTGTPPTITGIAPSSGPMAGGTEVAITGTGFTGATKVVFGITGAATSFTVDSDTQITATAPASDTAVTRNIRVTTAGGTSPAEVAGRFTYQEPRLLSVTLAGTGSGGVSSDPAGIDCGGDCAQAYADGTTVTLTAAPSQGSDFAGWSGGGCAGTAPCSVSMHQAQDVTATFTVTRWTLTITISGGGDGTVTSTPDGIDCRSSCGASFDHDTVVTLTATPDLGSEFTGWSGGGCSGIGPCTVAITHARDVVATFTIEPSITVYRDGNGYGTVTSDPEGISCGDDCYEEYPSGSMVTLTATPGVKSGFAGWSGGGCSGTGSCVVSVTSRHTVRATFRLTAALTVTRGGNGSGTVSSSPGGIICGTDCSESYTAGTLVSLGATPEYNSVFAGWSGGGCSGTGSCVVSAGAVSVITANFVLKTWQLTVSKGGTGSGTLASSPGRINCGSVCNDYFQHGTKVTITATPSADSTFAGWLSGPCGSNPTCTVTMDQTRFMSASFRASVSSRSTSAASKRQGGFAASFVEQ